MPHILSALYCLYFLSHMSHVILFALSEQSRQKMDKANVHRSVPDPSHGVRDGFLHQLHRYLLPRLQSHPIWHHGGF